MFATVFLLLTSLTPETAALLQKAQAGDFTAYEQIRVRVCSMPGEARLAEYKDLLYLEQNVNDKFIVELNKKIKECTQTSETDLAPVHNPVAIPRVGAPERTPPSKPLPERKRNRKEIVLVRKSWDSGFNSKDEVAFEGKRPLTGREFYTRLGESKFADSYEIAHNLRNKMVLGGAIGFGVGFLIVMPLSPLVAFPFINYSAEPGSSNTFLTVMVASVGVSTLATVISGAIAIAGFGMEQHPISYGEALDLVEAYNQGEY